NNGGLCRRQHRTRAAHRPLNVVQQIERGVSSARQLLLPESSIAEAQAVLSLVAAQDAKMRAHLIAEVPILRCARERRLALAGKQIVQLLQSVLDCAFGEELAQ